MDKMTFSALPYKRPDFAALSGFLAESTEKMKHAGSEEALALLDEVIEALQHFESQYQIAYIRNSIDTGDSFYDGEIAFFNETLPHLELAKKPFFEAALASPALPVMKEKYGDLYFTRLERKQRLADPRIVDDQVAESRLVQEYCRITASASADFRGESLNFYGLLKKMQDADRNVRREAMTCWSGLYQSIAGRLDEIYTEMLDIRQRMAKTLGFASFEDLIFLQMERFDYTKEDIARYREEIVRYVVPAAAQIFKEKKEALHLDQLHFYDESAPGPDGDTDPVGSAPELVEKARQLYCRLSPETGEFFDFMTDHEMFDLVSRPGKATGGYCTFIPDEKAPFIFSNFNGTAADVDVLTHEAGHAFQSYTASRAGVPFDVVFPTAESAEIHSMSMELLTYPDIALFFGDDPVKAQRYRRTHLQEAVCSVPYIACVDEFQEVVYRDNLTAAADRRALWHRLEQKYLPWRDYDGDEFLAGGGFWMQKLHIFTIPFYYVDYSLAQMSAFEYFLRAEDDRAAAFRDYLALCRAGGRYSYLKLLSIGGLHSPLAAGTVEQIMKKLRRYIL